MIFVKTNPYGIDDKLKRIQSYLDDNLSWNGTLEIYGKVEKTLREKSVIPEAYKSGNEYKEIFFNDKVSCTIGFLVKDRMITNNRLSANVDIIFTVNLKKIYSTTIREDELCLIDAKQAIKKSLLVDSINKIKVGIDEVFNGFDKDRINSRDMNPWFVFSFETEISYNENKTCN